MVILSIALFAIAFGAAYGWFSDKSTKLRNDEFNRNLRKHLEERRKALGEQFEQQNYALLQREDYINELREQFDSGVLNGRKWLSAFVAEADRSLDEAIVSHLRHKKHPALKAAEQVSEARAERRKFKEQAKFLEYQLRSLKEYFPFLEEYEEAILDEAIPLLEGEANLAALEESDPVLRLVSKAEYDGLPPSKRNQLALDRYLSRNLSSQAIGRLYECYLGYLYEREGWKVDYHGIVKGFEDLGRDLICTRGNEVKIVQAKCWSGDKTIHEKHIFQLFGTTQMYLMDRKSRELFSPRISASFETTTSLSPVARQAAAWLQIEVKERQSLDKTFPMIKCNINQATKDKIYHLPFDQQYHRTKIVPELGELYARTALEAEAKGFRRAFRFSGSFA